MPDFRTLPRAGKFLVLITAMLWLGSGNPALAAGDGPCAEDIQKFCEDTGKRGVAKCLKAHADELSPSCKESIAGAKQKMRDFSQACKSDASKFCKDVRPGGGRIVQCLKQNESELSAECQEALRAGK